MFASMNLILLSSICVWTISAENQTIYSHDENDINTQKIGNVVYVDVFGEAKCPDTTRFMKRHLLPTMRKLQNTATRRLVLKYTPFGVKTYCVPQANEDYQCTCHHGPMECVLNALQACVISALPDINEHLPIVGCIQGHKNLDSAVDDCITSTNLDSTFMSTCATTSIGRTLLYQNSHQENERAPDLNWVPWILINGERVPKAEYDLFNILCTKYFDPVPPQCL